MKQEWHNYPDEKPEVEKGKDWIDVIVRTASLHPYPMIYNKITQKFVGGDAIIIQWRYKQQKEQKCQSE